jgi:putative integral membrane protein (TIGR02587 family)
LNNETGRFLKGVVRGIAGAAILGMPLLLTMEMWWFGFTMERWKIALMLVSALPVLMFLSHFSGFSAQGHWKETILDGFVVFLIGLVLSPVILALVGEIKGSMAFEEILGKVALLAIPTGLGAALARSLLEATGDEEEEKKHRISKARELFLRVVGALAIGFDVAPTDEMPRIAAQTHPWQMLALMLLCVGMVHGFVFGLEQKGHRSIPAAIGQARLFFTTSLPGYVAALAVSAYLLWLFGRFDGVGMGQALGTLIVLGVPASLGAAAVRVVL